MVSNKALSQSDKLTYVRTDLYAFYRYYVARSFKENVPAKHIDKLATALMKVYRGDFKRLCVAMPPRHKLSNSTPVLTTMGWKTHGELKVGDYVFGLDGEPTKIIGTSDESVCDRLVTFSNGSKVKAHSGHLWSVQTRGGRHLQIKSTLELEDNLCEYDKNGKMRYRYHLPLINPVNFNNDTDLPIDPYFLGYWLGDGSASKACITHSKLDSQFIDKVPYDVSTQCEHKATHVLTTYFSNQGIIEKLRELNLYNNKHIPNIYKYASFEDRIELLAGLIDSDGSVDSNGRVRFVNTNKTLIDDYYELCNGLGLYSYIGKPVPPEVSNQYKMKSKYYKTILSTKTSYCVGFQPRFSIPTTIPRKRIVKKGIRRRLSIINIEKVDGELGKCIEISNPDGVYLVGKELIPTHNSKSSMVTEAFPLWLILHNPKLNILIVNNSASLSEKFGIALRELIRQYGKEFNVYLSDVKSSSTYLMFSDEDNNLYTGSIRLVGAGGSITGQDADYIIIDDPYEGFTDITPTLLGKKINWFNTIIEQRIEPHTRLIILHTRWHSQDLQGYLKEQDSKGYLEKNSSGKYHFITFPAILPNGEPLWPERYTKEILEDKRDTLGPRLFNAIYQQEPLDETSDFFDLSKIHWGKPDDLDVIIETSKLEELDKQFESKLITQDVYDAEKLKLKRNINEFECRGWDIAGSDDSKGDKNDYTVGGLMYRTVLGEFVVPNVVRGQFGDDTKTVVKNTANMDGYNTTVLVETGVAAAAKLLFNEWQAQLPGFMVERAEAIKSKVDRATPLKNAILDGKLYIDIDEPELREAIIQEFKSFPEGKHDDIVDALAHTYNYLARDDSMNYGPGLEVVYL